MHRLAHGRGSRVRALVVVAVAVVVGRCADPAAPQPLPNSDANGEVVLDVVTDVDAALDPGKVVAADGLGDVEPPCEDVEFIGCCDCGDTCGAPPKLQLCEVEKYSGNSWCCPSVEALADGTVCNGGQGVCTSGACLLAATATACDDGNPCTHDHLTENGNACKHINAEYQLCVMVPSWHWEHICLGGQCLKKDGWNTPGPLPCTTHADCHPLLEKAACHAWIGCVEACGPWHGRVCAALGHQDCQTGTHDCQMRSCGFAKAADGSLVGVCNAVPQADGKLCDDGKPGNGPDLCKGGACGG